MKTSYNRVLHFGVSGIVSLLVFLFSKDLFFFWDTVQLASKHGHWYYENNFSHFFLPEHIDSGHPPIFGMYQAAVWKLLGKTLWSSHLAMIPFVWVFIYYTLRFVQDYSGTKSPCIAVLAIVSCTPMVGHIVLVSPDVVLMSMFVASLYFLRQRKTYGFVLTILILAIISQRGFVIALALMIWALVYRKEYGRSWIAFLPGLFLFLFFYVAHYLHTGWNVAHADSPWSSSFEMNSLSAIVKNVAIYGWRLLDFGMIACWMGLGFIMIKMNKLRCDPLLILMIWLILVLGGVTIPFTGLVNHRYYLPIHWLLSVMVIANVYRLDFRFKRVLLFLVALVAMSGHRWIYPNHISQGWDTSLCHLPFYNLRNEALQYTEKNSIPIGEISTGFPLSSDQRFIDLYTKGTMNNFDLSIDSLVLWSNVMNTFKDQDIMILEKNFVPIFDRSKRGVEMKLYKRK